MSNKIRQWFEMSMKKLAWDEIPSMEVRELFAEAENELVEMQVRIALQLEENARLRAALNVLENWRLRDERD